MPTIKHRCAICEKLFTERRVAVLRGDRSMKYFCFPCHKRLFEEPRLQRKFPKLFGLGSHP